MSLDDRMRGAYDRQLDDVRRRVGPLDGVTPPEPLPPSGPRAGARVLAIAAAIAVVGTGIAVMAGLVADRSTPLVTDPATVGSTTDAAPQPSTSEPVIQVETTIAAPAPTNPGRPTDEASAVTATEPGAETGPTGAGPTAAAAIELAAGVDNAVCPSGRRAELELATTSYVGATTGWNRKDDLIDEQDGPFYFQAWEPGFDRPVEVEIVLDQPVLAAEVRVAQDPYTPVAGAITVTIDGRSEPIELDGTGGWRVLRLSEPTVLERLTVRRDQAEANIAELLVCVEAR